MKFCPKCGTTLLPVKKGKHVVLNCPKCGYETTKGEKAVAKIRQDRENIIVIGREEQKVRTLPKTKVECSKCGNREAYYWLVQTRGADESSTQFFRCTKCNATWRETT